MTREKYRTEKTVFDSFTISHLQKLEADGFLEIDTLIPLFVGKEANVFIAEGKKGKVIVKIYRLETCDFLQMYKYLQGDTRVTKLSRKRREIIFAWVRREYRNLLKAREARVNCPTPLEVKHNILVMEMIGEPAEKLKDDTPEDPEKFYKGIMKEMKKILKSGLVHADLSAFNILNLNDKPVIIDFSQSITKESPHAKEYLERDLKNVNQHFRKLKLKEEALYSVDDLLK